ncbi:MAG: hypothetical protein PHD43_24220 [Methylococcales bacterium]|nr:hypothetical protein [Methylococcales bacterium]
MKVFAYDIVTGTKGTEILGNINCCGYGSYGMKLPEVKLPSFIKPDSNWQVAGKAEDKQGRSIHPAQFKRDAICFCIGEMRCGTDISWEWVILVTPLKGESK